jgi:hypothetical protein
MKKTAILAGAALLLTFMQVNAQEEQPVKKNPTVDSIAAKYKLLEMPKALTIDQIFPVIGQYQLTNSVDNSAVGSVVITLDEQNKGTVWIEGLPQGRVYAQLRRSPSTYKIPAQKMADGTMVPEGTLIYDNTSRVVSISLGKPYNIANPEAVFTVEGETVAVTEVKTKGTKTKVKTEKSKHLLYTGTKAEQTTVMN